MTAVDYPHSCDAYAFTVARTSATTHYICLRCESRWERPNRWPIATTTPGVGG